MSLSVLTIEQSEKWDRIVRSFAQNDVYYLSGYAKAFQIHGDGEPMLFYYEDSNTRGINVVMKRDIALDPHFTDKLNRDTFYDFATPYGYGGWLIEGEKRGELFEAYDTWCQKNAIISEFVRFLPMLRNHEYCAGAYEVVGLGKVVHMDLSSPELIWQNISSKNRNTIRKAVKNGVKIYHGRFPEIYETFRIIYNETMKYDNAEKYYYFSSDFYRSLLEDLPMNAQVFWAEKDGSVIAASIFLLGNGRMTYHLSGSVRDYRTLAPTNLLLYEAALWGSVNGYKTLYLGGGVGSREDNLFKFKRGFYKGELSRFYLGKRIFDALQYRELLNVRTKVDASFFPLYRAPDVREGT